MKRLILAMSLVAWSPAAHAIVGGAPAATDAAARAVMTIISSRGTFCSGALIAPDLVLTAAHCVAGGGDYKLVQYDSARQPQLRDVKRVAAHPKFSLSEMNGHRATADVALLQLAQPLSVAPLPYSAPLPPLAAGVAFRIVGIGVTLRGDGKSGGVARAASLVATGKPGTLQIRLVDPATNNARAGLGACTGDSGAPVIEDQNGSAVIVGVVSWSTAANNSAGCGGLTGTTPLTLYREWITQTSKMWGATR